MKDNTVPLKLIALLANGEFHSGEQLGETLGMSRAAINKHIQTLRDWGVDVFTVPGKGYSLPEPIQLLNAEQILGQLDGGSVTVLPVIDSTNQYLLDRIGELKSGDACVAEYQQAGRGRRGRKWFSVHRSIQRLPNPSSRPYVGWSTPLLPLPPTFRCPRSARY